MLLRYPFCIWSDTVSPCSIEAVGYRGMATVYRRFGIRPIDPLRYKVQRLTGLICIAILTINHQPEASKSRLRLQYLWALTQLMWVDYRGKNDWLWVVDSASLTKITWLPCRDLAKIFSKISSQDPCLGGLTTILPLFWLRLRPARRFQAPVAIVEAADLHRVLESYPGHVSLPQQVRHVILTIRRRRATSIAVDNWL